MLKFNKYMCSTSPLKQHNRFWCTTKGVFNILDYSYESRKNSKTSGNMRQAWVKNKFCSFITFCVQLSSRKGTFVKYFKEGAFVQIWFP